MADPIVNTTEMKEPLVVSASSLQMLWDQSIAWILSHYLQIAIAGTAGAMIVAALLGLRWLGKRLCRREGNLTHWPATIGAVIMRTHLWFMVLFAAKLVSGYADPPHLVAQTIDIAFTIASAFQGALWVREFILGIVEHRAGGASHSNLSSAIGIIRLLVTVILFCIAIVAILDNIGVNVTGLIAGLGVGGIAIGLAAKGIFDDLFSALSIIFDRPFQQGDSIRWDATSGTVEAIGLKTTRVRAVTGEEIIISNTRLLDKELHNMARLHRRRVEFTLHIAYHTPADELEKIQPLIRAVLDTREKTKLVRCGISDLALPVIELKIEFDVQSQDWNEVFQLRHDVAIDLLAALAEAAIELAGPDGKSITPPVNSPPRGAAGGPPIEAEAGTAAA
jgi:small-conductance mechanosensitive channel